jgi:NAD(P)-dependent dehydrogenase (short-subunit alcohol dehydrogenase family)
MSYSHDPGTTSPPESPATAPQRFAGKTALITGVNDRGLGGAIALRLAREGATISSLGIDEPKRITHRIEKLGGKIVWKLGDIRNTADLQSWISDSVERFGRIDVLVNNAGIDISGRLESHSDADLERLIAINVTGAIKAAREVLPALRQPGGVIVNIASATGLGGCALLSAYSASKAALIGFTQSLALELVGRKQRVVAVAPGAVISPMTRKHLGDTKQGIGAVISRADQVLDALPFGVGLPEDVASAVAFLASDEARWISGVVLPLGFCPAYPQPIAHSPV